jgi:hypothetical protein
MAKLAGLVVVLAEQVQEEQEQPTKVLLVEMAVVEIPLATQVVELVGPDKLE